MDGDKEGRIISWALNKGYTVIYDENECSDLLTYFLENKDRLPVLLIITEGNYGATVYDDYAAGQVIRFQEYCSVKRVLARESREVTEHNSRFLDISINIPIGFHVVQGKDKLKPVQRLKAIIEENSLPCLVQFSSSSTHAYSKNKDGSPAQLLITHTYNDYYLQGNSFVEGELLKESCAANVIPLISVARVTGILNKSPAEFDKMMEDMNEFVTKNVNFKDIEDKKDIRIIDFQDKALRRIIGDQDFEIGARAPELPERNRKHDIHKTEERYKEDDISKADDTYEELPDDLEQNQEYRNTSKQFSPAKLENAKIDNIAKQSKSNEEGKTKHLKFPLHSLTRKQAPALPKRPDHHEYESLDKVHREGNTYTDLNLGKANHVQTMSISEISDALKKLKLEKYVKRFEEELVDGTILQHFGEKDLISEFSFSKIEAVRLATFIKSGHIPR